MPEDEVGQSFKRAGEAFERMPRKPIRLPLPKHWFPHAPEQMKKWFNTTSGFVCGIFGGLLMVGVAAIATAAVGFIAFIAVFYVVAQANLTRCTNEYFSERGEYASEEIIQECRVKVGLGRSDGKDKGYWK